MNDPVKIRKYSGELVDFDESKLISSLKNANASDEIIRAILTELYPKLYDGISTRDIYLLAYKILKRKRAASASRYRLKKAIMELGPSGYPFERFVGEILAHEGFRTEVGVVVEGLCVTHEVDVEAFNHEKHISVECKYHNRQGRVNDVKIPLYIHSRFQDIQKKCELDGLHDELFHEGWIYTNTRFTSDAIRFAECAGLKLVSWDYPHGNSLKDKINKLGLFPVTSLAVLTKNDKILLLESGVVLCKDLHKNPDLLIKAGIAKKKHNAILRNLDDLCTY